ncbi:MAG: DUF3782 domain-containing protein [Deltaproteobacteria bacterium]|nr:DUF3782 domain-containing protein [Deltaproteobacteria bacterium]
MTDQVSFEDIKELFRETDRKMQQTAEQMRETDRELRTSFKELNLQLGHLGNRLGEFVEGVVRPGLVRLFRERGIEVHGTLRDVGGSRDGVACQVDLLVVNDKDAVAVEVKSKLDQRDVDEHVERLGKFKLVFPVFASKRLLGAMGAMVIPDGAAAYAEKRGLFVIGQSGEDAVLLNSEGFVPGEW